MFHKYRYLTKVVVWHVYKFDEKRKHVDASFSSCSAFQLVTLTIKVRISETRGGRYHPKYGKYKGRI